jgi:hypothetical protein
VRVDKDGVVHFDMGGDIDAGATDASLGAAGEVNAADAIAGATDASLGAAGAANAAAAGAANAAANSFDVAGLANLSNIPGQTIEGAIAQALFDLALQQDTTTAAGMKDAISTLGSLANLGYGKTEGLNPNNPTQSVDEMRNAHNVSNVIGYALPALLGFIPNYGIVSTIGRVGAGLMSNTMTPAQALTAGIAGALGAKTGIPGPVLEGIFSGNFGKAAGAGVQGGLTSLANNLTGSPLGGLALNLSGIGPAVNKGVAEAVSGGTGGSRSSGLGAALGLPSAPSQGSSPTGNTYGDAGVNADIYPVLAAIEQAAQEPKQPEWSSQMTAGRYGPLMDYQFGA